MNISTTAVGTFLALLTAAGGHLPGSAAPAPTVTAAVLGDSYAAGFGADPAHAWERYAAVDLGWSLQAVVADPGAGYVATGQQGSYEAALRAHPLPATVRQVLVQGGFNDRDHGPDEVGPAVTRTLDLIHAQAPDATVTVVGTFDPRPDIYDSLYPNLRGDEPAIEQAVLAHGDRYIDGLQFTYEVSPDGVHPTPTGHVQLGEAIAARMQQLDPSAGGGTPARAGAPAAAVIGVSRVEANGLRSFYLASTAGGHVGTVTRVAFGDPGDLPTLLPNAYGQCTPAVYRPSTGTLYAASATIDGGGLVVATPFGGPGDQPVQNAPYGTPSGRATFVRGATDMTFYEGVPTSAEQTDAGTLVFGAPADRGFLYSAPGTGTTVGVYRPGSSTFFLAAPGNSAVAPVTAVRFGDPGDQGLVGAWGGPSADGTDHVGVFRPSEGRWYLAETPTPNTGGAAAPVTSVTSFYFGSPGDTALACDPPPAN